MAKASAWASRVAEWRASGQTAKEFCAARGFSPKTLVWWSSSLRRRGAVPIARVVRVPDAVSQAGARGGDRGVVVELGAVCVRVAAGFDRETLRAVLDVLETRGRDGAA